MVRYSRVSRLCDHQTSDDRISEKLGVTDLLPFVPSVPKKRNNRR